MLIVRSANMVSDGFREGGGNVGYRPEKRFVLHKAHHSLMSKDMKYEENITPEKGCQRMT